MNQQPATTTTRVILELQGQKTRQIRLRHPLTLAEIHRAFRAVGAHRVVTMAQRGFCRVSA